LFSTWIVTRFPLVVGSIQLCYIQKNMILLCAQNGKILCLTLHLDCTAIARITWGQDGYEDGRTDLLSSGITWPPARSAQGRYETMGSVKPLCSMPEVLVASTRDNNAPNTRKEKAEERGASRVLDKSIFLRISWVISHARFSLGGACGSDVLILMSAAFFNWSACLLATCFAAQVALYACEDCRLDAIPVLLGYPGVRQKSDQTEFSPCYGST
jgi:hypothetical protein